MITTYPKIRDARTVSGGPQIRSVTMSLTLTGLLFLFGSGLLRAQSVTAILVGTVTDQSGATVPGAAVSVTLIGTNAKRMVLSNDNGDFTVPGLPPGTYQVMAGHEGFKQTVVGQVELLVNQTARVNVVLQVGTIAESVEVTGAAPLVASETSTLGQVVTTKQIEDLPLKGRAVFNLALLSPERRPRRRAPTRVSSVPCRVGWVPRSFPPPADGTTRTGTWLTASRPSIPIT